MHLLLLQCHVKSIAYWPVGSVGKLQEVWDFRWCITRQTLTFLHDYRGWSDRSCLVLFCFFGTAMMAEALKQAGTWHVCSEMLKMSVNTGNNWSAQHFRMETDIVLVLCRCSVSCFHLFQVWRKVSWEIKKLLKKWNNLCAHAKTLLPFPASSQLSLHSLGVNKVLSLI